MLISFNETITTPMMFDNIRSLRRFLNEHKSMMWKLKLNDVIKIHKNFCIGDHDECEFTRYIVLPSLYKNIINFDNHHNIPFVHSKLLVPHTDNVDNFCNVLPNIFDEKSQNFMRPFILNEQKCDVIHRNLADDEYINYIDIINYKDVFVRSPMGSGKSTCIVNMFNDPLLSKKSILIISPRITITHTIHKKFTDAGIEMNTYLNLISSKTLNDVNERKRLIISPNSLYKIRKYVCSYDYVIIDEIMLLLSYINGKHPANKKIILEIFMAFLCNAQKLIICDAYLHDKVVDIIMSYRHEYSPDDINSVYYSFTKQPSIMYEHKTYNTFIKHISTIDRAYIFCETKKIAKTIFDKIINDNKILITGNTNKSLLKDPNSNFINYDVIVTTPVILSGFDFNIDGHFNEIYGVYNGNIISPMSLMQMSGRIRCAHKCTFVRKSKSVYDDTYLSDDYFMSNMDKYSAINPICHYDDYEFSIQKTLISELCMFIIRYEHVIKNKLNLFIKYL